MSDLKQYTINPKAQDTTIQILINRIDNGFELQKMNLEDMDDQKMIDYNDSIIIAPDYQREYRSTVKDESSLIESLVVGIPIPPIFLANDRFNGVQVMNVIDGQHRLRAFHRFIKDKYKLTELSIVDEMNDKKYSDLNLEFKQELLSKEISLIVFKDFPGKDFEIEIFNRYNKGTKPLTPQEIRHAVYNSEFNQYVNSFSTKLFKENTDLTKAYNITKDRLQKKKLQESIFIILSILEAGIDPTLSNSPKYTEYFMKTKSELEKNDPQKFKEVYKLVINRFSIFNEFILKLIEYNEYPFSKEIYGISSRNYKFQISIAMILSAICNKVILTIGEENFLDSIDYTKFNIYLGNILSESFLEDPEYSASTTNPKKLIDLIDDIKIAEFMIETHS